MRIKCEWSVQDKEQYAGSKPYGYNEERQSEIFEDEDYTLLDYVRDNSNIDAQLIKEDGENILILDENGEVVECYYDITYTNPDDGEYTLAEALKRAKMSQTELAKELGIKPQHVSIWVRGKYSPRPETQRKIDAILKCNVSYG